MLTFYITVLNNGNVFKPVLALTIRDLLPHAAVDAMLGSTVVGFKDLLGGGDMDYNDLSFSFSKHRVPEPFAWALMVAGLGLIGGVFRGQNRQRFQVSYF